MIAALYVERGGVYYAPGLDVDPWDEARDARLYAGPWSVVAHPPCARWCRLAELVESRGGARVGDDGGTFAAALAAVRQWSGVLEHPACSKAWPAFGLPRPAAFGWTRDLFGVGWVCEVSQTAYGHRARKLTWLYYVGDVPPSPLSWCRPWASHVVSTSRGPRADPLPELRARERARTPPTFRDALLALARGARVAERSEP